MKEGTCEKCKQYGPIDEHHILPQNIFKGDGDVVKLCPTCHRKYHNYMGHKNLKNTDMAFHFYTFAKWMSGLIIIGTIISFTYFNHNLIHQYIKTLLAIQF